MKLSKKKAFTLVELLVIVLVLGVLAGVGVPKFKRMLETRKTGEAEAMLSAVRMEQEKRCVAGKEYRTDLNKLDVLSTASGSKNYTYKLTSTGIVAEAKGKSKEADQYNLQLTSYKEGNICCAGAGCKKLNKNYPECKALVRDECSADVQCTGAEPAHDKTDVEGRCTLSYSQDVECDKDYGNWKESGFVLASKRCECEDEKITETGSDPECTRTKTGKTCNHDDGTWSSYDYGEWSGYKLWTEERATTDGKCITSWEQDCDSNGQLGSKQLAGEDCSCEGKEHGEETKDGCTVNWTRECIYGVWKNYREVKSNCTCVGKPKPSENQTISIDHGSCQQTRTVTCNPYTDEYNDPAWTTDYSTCTCDSEYTWNSSTKKCDPAETDCTTNPNQEKCCQSPKVWENGTCKAPTCNKTDFDCPRNKWYAFHLNHETCECFCPEWGCEDYIKKGNDYYDPEVGQPCYWKANLANGAEADGGWVTYVGTIQGNPECVNCRRNITCVATGVRHWEHDKYGGSYMYESMIDQLNQTYGGDCLRPEDLGRRLYTKQDCDKLNRQVCKDHNAQHAPNLHGGDESLDRCCYAIKYDCKAGSTLTARWTEFEYGTPN